MSPLAKLNNKGVQMKKTILTIVTIIASIGSKSRANTESLSANSILEKLKTSEQLHQLTCGKGTHGFQKSDEILQKIKSDGLLNMTCGKGTHG